MYSYNHPNTRFQGLKEDEKQKHTQVYQASSATKR
jgi:hypothetical protein